MTLSAEARQAQPRKRSGSFLFKTNRNLIQEFQLLRLWVSMATAPLPTLERALCGEPTSLQPPSRTGAWGPSQGRGGHCPLYR